MELKVSVEGVERSVSGINESTTCAQIIYALAHATAQKGRFAMIEKFRNVEHRLSPDDRPLDKLRKWRENASNVTFILKRIVDDDAIPSSSNPSNDCSESTLPFRNTSSSSMVAAQLNTPFCAGQSSSRSTCSLPVLPNGTSRERPPPPDYRTVMDMKFASLSRGQKTRPSITKTADESTIFHLGLSLNDLIVLIERQRIAIEKQKETSRRVELSLSTDIERELIQLDRQQENLRSILEPMKLQNWPSQYETEMKKSRKLRAAVEATKEHMDKVTSDLDLLRKEERELLLQISAVSKQTTECEPLSTSLSNLPDSLQKMRAC